MLDKALLISFMIGYLLFLLGCGSTNGPANSTEPGNKKIGNNGGPAFEGARLVDSLPDCNGDSEGELVYLLPEETFYTCDGSSWAEIDLKGPAGKDGKDGTNGTNGSDGEDQLISALETETSYQMTTDSADLCEDSTTCYLDSLIVDKLNQDGWYRLRIVWYHTAANGLSNIVGDYLLINKSTMLLDRRVYHDLVSYHAHLTINTSSMGSVSIRHDTDQNGLDSADDIIKTYILTEQ